jgi:hypothetical protein
MYYRIRLLPISATDHTKCNPFTSTRIFKTKACSKILSKLQEWSNLNYFLTSIKTTGLLILHKLFTEAVFQNKYGICSILYLASWTILLVQPLNQFKSSIPLTESLKLEISNRFPHKYLQPFVPPFK